MEDKTGYLRYVTRTSRIFVPKQRIFCYVFAAVQRRRLHQVSNFSGPFVSFLIGFPLFVAKKKKKKAETRLLYRDDGCRKSVAPVRAAFVVGRNQQCLAAPAPSYGSRGLRRLIRVARVLNGRVVLSPIISKRRAGRMDSPPRAECFCEAPCTTLTTILNLRSGSDSERVECTGCLSSVLVECRPSQKLRQSRSISFEGRWSAGAEFSIPVLGIPSFGSLVVGM